MHRGPSGRWMEWGRHSHFSMYALLWHSHLPCKPLSLFKLMIKKRLYRRLKKPHG